MNTDLVARTLESAGRPSRVVLFADTEHDLVAGGFALTDGNADRLDGAYRDAGAVVAAQLGISIDWGDRPDATSTPVTGPVAEQWPTVERMLWELIWETMDFTAAAA